MRMNQRFLRRIMGPLIKLLGFDEQIIMALISIFNREPKGWQILAHKLAKKRVNGSELMQKLLNMINWRKFQDMAVNNQVLQDPMKLIKENFIDSILSMSDIVMKFIDPRVAKNMLQSNVILRSLISMIKAIYQRDIEKILTCLKDLRILFGIQDIGIINFFESLMLLLNRKVEKISKESIHRAVETFSNFLSQMIDGRDGDQVDGIKKSIKGLVNVIFGAVYFDWKLLEQGARKMNKGFSFILDIFRQFSQVKNFKKVNILTLLRSGIPFGQRLKLSIRVIVRAIINIVKMFTDEQIQAQKQKEEQKGDKNKKDQEKKPTKQNKMPNIFGKPSEKIIDWLNKLYEDFQFEFQAFPPNLINMSEKKSKHSLESSQFTLLVLKQIKKAKDSVQKPGSFDKSVRGQDRYQLFMTALISGDIHLFLNVLRNASYKVEQAWKQAIQLALACHEIITMTSSEFTDIVEKILCHQFGDYQPKNYDDPLSRFGINISMILKKFFERKKKKSQNLGSVSQKNSLDKFFELIQKPKTLAGLAMLLMGIRFKLLSKSFMFKILIFLIQEVGDGTGWKRDGKNLDDSFEDLIISFFGCKIENLAKAADESFSMDERINKLIDFFVLIFVPDLEVAKALIQRLVKIIFELYQNKNFNTIGNVMQDVIQDLGHLFGVNPQLLDGIIGILNGDYEALAKMAAPIANIEPELITRMVKFLKEVKNTLFDYEKRNAIMAQSKDKKGDLKQDQWRDIMQKIQQGRATNRELFQMVDQQGDGSGGISKQEFKAMLKRLSIKMSDHRIAEIFTSAQKHVSGNDDENPDELNEKQFDEAMKYVDEKSSSSALELLGLSTTQLILIFVSLLVILLLLFVFIFLGINAFAIGGTFGSIINSLLPVGAGLTVGRKKDVDQKGQEKKAQQAYEEVDHILQSQD